MMTFSTNQNSDKGILLVHGLTGTPTEMKLLGRFLKQAGFKIEIPLLPGHGLTSTELLNTHYDQWLDAVETHYKDLRKHCKEVYIVGMCMGGMLGLLLASDKTRQQPDGVIIMGPHLDYFSNKTSLLRYIFPILFNIPIPRLISDRLFWTEAPPYGLKDERLINKITQEINKCEDTAHGTFRTYLTSFREMHRLIQTVKKKLPLVKCPVLLLQAIDDSFLSPKNALQLYQQVGSSRKQLLFINGTDHMLPIDLRKKEVWNWIRQYAETIDITDAYTDDYTDKFTSDSENYEMLLNATKQQVCWPDQEISIYRQGKHVATISAQVVKKDLIPSDIFMALNTLYCYINRLTLGNYLFTKFRFAKTAAALFSIITSIF